MRTSSYKGKPRVIEALQRDHRGLTFVIKCGKVRVIKVKNLNLRLTQVVIIVVIVNLLFSITIYPMFYYYLL